MIVNGCIGWTELVRGVVRGVLTIFANFSASAEGALIVNKRKQCFLYFIKVMEDIKSLEQVTIDRSNFVKTISSFGSEKPRLNPFLFPSDTDFRFILFIISIVSATFFIYSYLFPFIPGEIAYIHNMYASCIKAGSLAHPGTSIDELLARNSYVQACNAPVGLAQFYWTLGGVVLMLVLAGIFCWLLPLWTFKRKKLEPLSEEDVPEVVAYLKTLCREATLPYTPQFVWNPLDLASNPVAFGSFGRYYIAVSGGLVKNFYKNLPTFRAVVLHELAHLRNADITKTYFTTTLGWTFGFAVLLPFVCTILYNDWHRGWEISLYINLGLRILVLVLLVYLIQRAVLRAREFYADVRASVWDGRDGALTYMLSPTRSPRISLWKRLFSFHPLVEERKQIVQDTFKLFGMGFWEAFATGMVFTITVLNFNYMLGLLHLTEAQIAVPGWVLALPVVGVVGIGVWRCIFARILLTHSPSHLWSLMLGLWLGLLFGQSFSFTGYLAQASYFSDLTIPIFTIKNNIIWQEQLVILRDQLMTFTQKQLVLGILESLPLLLVLFLFSQWMFATTSLWLRRASTYALPNYVYWIGILVQGIMLGILFELLSRYYLLVTSEFTSFSDSIMLIVLTFPFWLFVTFLHDPLTLIVSISFWLYPLAALLWRKSSVPTSFSSWAFLDAPQQSDAIQQSISSYQGSFYFKKSITIGLMGGLLGSILLVILTLGLHWETLYTPLGRALVAIGTQLCVAMFVTLLIKQDGWLHGLFAAFITGCLMTLGSMCISLVFTQTINVSFTKNVFLLAINGGAFLSLLPTLAISTVRRWLGFRRSEASKGTMVQK